jgi:4-hydroxy-3-polyprenylbenzoate decarboxylase
MDKQSSNKGELSDLDIWLEKAESHGELKRITAEVVPDLETSTIAYMSGKEVGSPALMFENVKGHQGFRSLYNMLGSSLARICLAIGEEPTDDPVAVVSTLKEKMGRKMAAETVPESEALVNQNVETGDEVDLTKFPAPRMWPLDGGKYIGTGDAIVTQDPETGRINLGTYRQMVKAKNEVGFYVSPGKDGLLDREKWWAMGKPAPVAAIYGLDPLLFIVAATSFPKDESEYDYYSGINGSPIEVFKSELTGLLLPARAEIIAEGFCYPDETFDEGPFGEFTGYYGRPEAPTPYIRIEKVRYRNNPILTCALMADWPSNECGLFWAMARAAKIWNDLDKMGVPGIRCVWSPPEAAGWGMTVVSIKQMYAGHAAQTMALAAQCMGGAYFSKYIVVVDDDVDASNLAEVVWAMVTRSRPAHSIDILRETWSTYLDPSQNPPEIRPWGSKCLINACMEYKYIDVFAPRSKLSEKAYRSAVGRWEELGFEGKPPKLSVFEETEFPETL